MARPKPEQLVTQSLLDRLAKDRPNSEPWPDTRAKSLEMYRTSVKEDVEWLLNTRQPTLPVLAHFPALASTVVNFGLPDIHEFHGGEGKDERALEMALERCIKAFEPRIRAPRVSIVRTDTLARSIKFQIEGVLRYEATEEPIRLDTVLELIAGKYEVKK